MKLLMSLIVLLAIVGSVLLGVAISWAAASSILSFLSRSRPSK